MEDNWITEMTVFLTTWLPPQQLSTDERKRLAVRSRNFCLLNNTLYHKGADGIWRRAARQFEKSVVLRESHCGIAGGHYVGEATGLKIWNSGLWWPTIMNDATDYCRKCDVCQRMGQPTERTRCLFNQCCLWNHSKSGDWTLSVHSNQQHYRQGIGTS